MIRGDRLRGPRLLFGRGSAGKAAVTARPDRLNAFVQHGPALRLGPTGSLTAFASLVQAATLLTQSRPPSTPRLPVADCRGASWPGVGPLPVGGPPVDRVLVAPLSTAGRLPAASSIVTPRNTVAYTHRSLERCEATRLDKKAQFNPHFRRPDRGFDSP
jgi:hypothetical protein